MIIITKDRRDFLRQSAAALAGAASLAAVPTWAAELDRAKVAASKDRRVPRGRFKAIDDALAQGVASGTVAAAVGLAADTRGIFYEGAYGKRDLGAGEGVDQDTVFWLLSMTKAITAAACMQLVEQGRLSLDEPASKVLPELASPKVLGGFDDAGKPILRPAKRAITLRHLLTHTSGYTYANWSDKLPQYEKVTGQPDIAYSLNGAFAAPLEFDPGDRWQYGIGMDVVGKLIEAVSGQSLEIYFRDHLFEPLGMANTGFLISGAQKRRTATTYLRQADGSLQAMPFEMNQRPEFFSGGGGLFGTPRDYMAFLQMLLKDGTHKGVRLLKPETVALMRSNAIGELNVNPLKSSAAMWSRDADLFPGMKQKWGLSFDINPEQGPNGRSAGSYAWAGLLNCYYWVDPVKKVTGAVFTQLLPFYDPRMVELFGAFERGVYAGLAKA
jgi:CubicO group peptidase (beta-lactamase class C family)